MAFVVFLVHLIWRYEIITYPPYWDALQAPFIEAIWLDQNNFDYLSLINLPTFNDGGPSIYVWSIIPTIYALLYRFTENPTTVFVILHVANFAIAGIMAAMIYNFLIEDLKQPWWLAILGALLVVFQPTVGAQIDTIAMDLPCASVILAASLALTRQRLRTAAALGMLAVFIKQSAVMIVLINATIGIIHLLTQNRRRRERFYYGILLILPFIVITILNSFSEHLRYIPADRSYRLTDCLRQFQNGLRDMPILFCIALVAVVAFPVVLARQRYWSRLRRDGWQATIREWLASVEHRAYTVSLAATCAFIAVWVSHEAMLNRYITWYAALFILCLITTLHLLSSPKAIILILYLSLLLFMISNQYGRWLPDLPPEFARSGHVRDRSREFLEDQRAMMRVIRWLETNAGDERIITPSPWERAMYFPELGYTRRRLNPVSSTVPYLQFPPIPFFLDLHPVQFENAFHVYIDTIYSILPPSVWSPGCSAQVVFSAIDGLPPVGVFRVIPVQPESKVHPENLWPRWQKWIERNNQKK